MQYSIVHGRALGQSWAYGGTPATVSRFVELGQAEPPVARERIMARYRHVVVGKGVSSTSANIGMTDMSAVGSGRRRGSGEDKVEALWRKAFNTKSLVPLEQYAVSSAFEDQNDRRNAETKYNWWGLYLAERRVRGLPLSDIMEGLLARYKETMESTLRRRMQGDRRRDSRIAAKAAVVDLVFDCSEIEEDDRPCGSSAAEVDVPESSVVPPKRKSRGASTSRAV